MSAGIEPGPDIGGSDTFVDRTPKELGYTMPPEWAPHERCWMAWPHREDLWRDLDATRRAYADVARAIRYYEPVSMVVHPDHVESAAAICGPQIDIVAIEIDDSWTRDSGPSFLVDGNGGLGGAAWCFNAWGNKHRPWFNDARLGERILRRAGAAPYRSPLVFEGGALHVDGEGTVITTETVVFNDNRNPGISREEAEKEICHSLGVEKVVWLPGDPDEYETNGHVDGIACFVKPAVVLYETNPDDSDPHSRTLKENLAALKCSTDARGRAFELVPIEEAWDIEGEGEVFCRSYVNFYIANGGIVAPAYGTAADQRVRELLASLYPGREVSLVDISAIAPGGGGIHCITQQQPAVCQDVVFQQQE